MKRFSKVIGFIVVFVVMMVIFCSVSFAAAINVTWNPNDKGIGTALSNNNLTATQSSFIYGGVRATEGVSTGKWYWEVKYDSGTSIDVGIANKEAALKTWTGNSIDENIRCYYSVNGLMSNGEYGSSFTFGDIVGVALDMDNGIVSFHKNGVYQGIVLNDIKSLGVVYPLISTGSSTGGTGTANFGATPFNYVIPEGYLPYNESVIEMTTPQPSNLLKLVLEVNEEKQLSISNELIDNTEMEWTSSDSTIATVDENGKVKALKSGNAIITCTSEDYIESINLLVVDLEYQLAVDLNIGDKCRLTVDDLANANVTWSSYYSTIANVTAKGKVTAISEGLTYIVASDKDGNEIGRIYIRVRQ